MNAFTGAIEVILYVLIAAIVIRSLLSWFPASRGNPVAQALYRFTDPLIEPVRRRMPRTGMFDLSPLIVIVALWIMLAVVARVP